MTKLNITFAILAVTVTSESMVLSACVFSESHRDSPSYPEAQTKSQPALTQMSFGAVEEMLAKIDCNACMHSSQAIPENKDDLARSCDLLRRQPVVAEVTGARIVTEERICDAQVSPSPPRWCTNWPIYSFAATSFLRNLPDARNPDLYQSIYTRNLYGELPPVAGVSLDPHRKYLIFAQQAKPSSGKSPRPRWYITAACPRDGENAVK